LLENPETAAYNKQITQGSRGEKSPEASLSVCPADKAPAEASGMEGSGRWNSTDSGPGRWYSAWPWHWSRAISTN